MTIWAAGLLSFFASCKGHDKKQQETLTTERFKVGQVWQYGNRSGEDSSTLTILKIEKYDKGDEVIHIRVDGVNIYNPQTATGYNHEIGHLPFSEQAITKSVAKLVGQNNNLPDFSDGYDQWKEAWDNGKGGYWTLNLKEAIDSIDKIMRTKE